MSTQMVHKSQFHHHATLADGLRLSAAFKNALTERRVAVRIAVQVHAQELGEGRNDQANLADGYKTRVEMLCWIFLGFLWWRFEVVVAGIEYRFIRTFQQRFRGV